MAPVRIGAGAGRFDVSGTHSAATPVGNEHAMDFGKNHPHLPGLRIFAGYPKGEGREDAMD